MADTKPTSSTAEQIAEWRRIIELWRRHLPIEPYLAAMHALVALEASQKRAEEAERLLDALERSVLDEGPVTLWNGDGDMPKPGRGLSFGPLSPGARSLRKKLETFAKSRLTEPESEKAECCSFCGKRPEHIRALIKKSRGVSICDECVQVCQMEIQRESEKGGAA